MTPNHKVAVNRHCLPPSNTTPAKKHRYIWENVPQLSESRSNGPRRQHSQGVAFGSAEPQFFVKSKSWIILRIPSFFQQKRKWERNRSFEVSKAVCFHLMFLWPAFDQWVTTVGQQCRLQNEVFWWIVL